MTANQLATGVRNACPRVQLMVEALLQAENDILVPDMGRIELAFQAQQVKMSLNVSLGVFKIDNSAKIA